MSIIHVRQIKSSLSRTFGGLLDLSDVADRPCNEKDNVFLTRALAALAVTMLTDIPAEDAARTVTDGWQDNGIDALYFHPPERVLYVVQSKWKHDGSGSIDRGDAQRFIKGFRDLINARFGRFNEKIQSRQSDIEAVLNDAKTRFVLILVYSGQQDISKDVREDFQDVLLELNDSAEVVTFRALRQANLYAAIAQDMQGEPINLDVALHEWGQSLEPFQAFYGQVAAADVATWWNDHYPRLFAPNIRMFLGNTDVNESLIATLSSEPDKFWYFNNGITALCSSIEKKPIGGSGRQVGYFECKGFRIVNGAQTAGAIAWAAAKHPQHAAQARVPIRIISLEQSPEGFEREVTRYNNTQNRIDRRDFVALDPEQDRIRTELRLEGVAYAYKSGETLGGGGDGFDLVEATIARACAHEDSGLAIQAKREIGRLWEDIDKQPYKILFNGSVSGPALWKLVQVLRAVDESLETMSRDADGRNRLLAVHGNRFISHLVYQAVCAQLDAQDVNLAPEFKEYVEVQTKKAYLQLLLLVDEIYPDSYLASLFKNRSKCQALKDVYNSRESGSEE